MKRDTHTEIRVNSNASQQKRKASPFHRNVEAASPLEGREALDRSCGHWGRLISRNGQGGKKEETRGLLSPLGGSDAERQDVYWTRH